MKNEKVVVTDQTSGAILAAAGRVADTPWSSFAGLMGRPSLPPGEGLIIRPCSSIHTHFMRFPIDVIYVNKEDVVVGIDRQLKPWRFGRFYKQVSYVIELPSGAAGACVSGDRIQIGRRAPCTDAT